MKFCNICGIKLEDGVQFCPSCGAKQRAIKNILSKEEIVVIPPVEPEPVVEEIAPAPEPITEPVVDTPVVEPEPVVQAEEPISEPVEDTPVVGVKPVKEKKPVKKAAIIVPIVVLLGLGVVGAGVYFVPKLINGDISIPVIEDTNLAFDPAGQYKKEENEIIYYVNANHSFEMWMFVQDDDGKFRGHYRTEGYWSYDDDGILNVTSTAFWSVVTHAMLEYSTPKVEEYVIRSTYLTPPNTIEGTKYKKIDPSKYKNYVKEMLPSA